VRIPFPSRIPLSYSSGFALILFVIEVLEGTPPEFSICTVAFILIATVAFNVAGGFSRPSGSYIFFYAVLAVILGLTYKAYLGERADSNLESPQLTMLVYLGGITGMLVAAFLKRLLLPRRALLEGVAERIDLDAAAIGCIIVGVAISAAAISTINIGGTADERYANNSGTVLSALSQVNQFVPLGLILGVTYTIRSSGGRRFLNSYVTVSALASILVYGIVSTSKQGFFLPIACVMIAAAAQRYQFSTGQVVAFAISMVFTFYYLLPFIAVGKVEVAAETFPQRASKAYVLLTDLGGARERQIQAAVSYEEDADYSVHYFNGPQGVFDRLQMISVDDALNTITDQGSVFGYSPLLFDVYSLVPHFIWPDKPLIALGNIYSHEIGMAHYSTAGDDDNTTGISFSPTADAFHMGSWSGLLLLAPLLWFLCFFVMDAVCGDTRKSPWGLLMVALCSHLAPEGLMTGPFYLMTIGPLMVIFVSFLAAYVLPVIGNVLKKPTLRRDQVGQAGSGVAARASKTSA
jgi:hypothetical protein